MVYMYVFLNFIIKQKPLTFLNTYKYKNFNKNFLPIFLCSLYLPTVVVSRSLSLFGFFSGFFL